MLWTLKCLIFCPHFLFGSNIEYFKFTSTFPFYAPLQLHIYISLTLKGYIFSLILSCYNPCLHWKKFLFSLNITCLNKVWLFTYSALILSDIHFSTTLFICSLIICLTYLPAFSNHLPLCFISWVFKGVYPPPLSEFVLVHFNCGYTFCLRPGMYILLSYTFIFPIQGSSAWSNG